MLQGPNLIYLFVAYGVFLGGITLYVLSLVLRQRNLRRDEDMLNQIEEQVREQEAEHSAVAQKPGE